jgi:hypothetical protein
MLALPSFLPYDISLHDIVIWKSPISFSTLSILLGSLAALVMTTPTFFKEASSVEVAKSSLRVTYLIVLPFFYALGMFLSIFSPQQDISNIALLPTGLGPFIITAYVLTGSWNVCSLNLYYGADIISQVISVKDKGPIVFFLGTLGVLFFGLKSQFVADFETAEFLGGIVVGILVIVLVRINAKKFSLEREVPQQQLGNYMALLISYIVGVLVWFKVIKITGVPFFDVALAALLSCLYFSSFPDRKFPAKVFEGGISSSQSGRKRTILP